MRLVEPRSASTREGARRFMHGIYRPSFRGQAQTLRVNMKHFGLNSHRFYPR